MATSYTSLLGLALPVQGELSGTWGDTVNNSITSLLDSAIAGTTTLSTDADVTLTTTTGAANTAREAILLCTGARTVLRNITAPAQSKTYTVINATTGGFAVVIRGVGPTAGISVPAGFTAQVAWNGSDFVQTAVPVTRISGLGTGVATALAVNVGTAGSPVVNGGVLGTPSSGTVTNLTGTASININGTVGATTPAAVSATSLTDSGNLNFTGTGNRITGDFTNATVASRAAFQTSTVNGTTSVAAIPNGSNTNANFAAYSNSGVTDAQRAQISCVGGSDVRVVSDYIGSGSYLPMTFYTGGSERVRVDTSGNVGIGKTPVAGRGLLQVNGDVEMTSQNTGQLAGLRNVIINGGMDVWQRSTSAAGGSSSSTAYVTVDRWQLVSNGFDFTNNTFSRQTGPTGARYCLRMQRNNGNSSINTLYAQTTLETQNSIPLAGKNVTLSFKARCGASYNAGTGTGLFNAFITSGTGVDQQGAPVGTAFTGAVSVATSAVTVTTTWQTFSISGSVASSATQLLASFYTAHTGTAGVSDYVELAQVQLEVGSVATPFEQRPYGMELALCQRYYYRIYPGAVNKALNSFGAGYSTTVSVCLITFPVTMRITPTALEQSGVANQYSVQQAGTGEIVCTAVPTYQSSTTQASAGIALTVASGLAQFAFQYAQTNSTNGANAYLGWSAEL